MFSSSDAASSSPHNGERGTNWGRRFALASPAAARLVASLGGQLGDCSYLAGPSSGQSQDTKVSCGWLRTRQGEDKSLAVGAWALTRLSCGRD